MIDKPDLPWDTTYQGLPGEGWWPIIAELDSNLRDLYPNYKVLQVKEKFGGLRYYVYGVDKPGYELIRAAELRAEETCEECGRPGALRSGGWWRTLCDADYITWRERRARRLAEMAEDDEVSW